MASLSTQCRQATSAFAQIQIEGLESNSYKENNSYELVLENVPSVYEGLIERSFKAEFRKDKLNHANDALEVEFTFKPMKPMKCTFDLVITKKHGSRWRYKVNA